MIDIKELALKHELVMRVDSPYANDYLKRQQAFADEYLALSSSNPVAYFAPNAGDTFSMLHWTQNQWYSEPLYRANPINQQLQTERDECVEEIKRLRKVIDDYESYR